MRRSWDAAPSWFGRLPSAPCEVRAVEAFREADMPAAFYNPPTEDGSRRGVYYINTYDLPSRDIHAQAGVSYHEANPGHHFQFTLEQEFLDRPRLRRFGGILAGSAFIEGWGLYSERLAEEMGLYMDDWERLGMLENQGLRAARLITDTGIHAFGWTREAAIAKLEESGATRTEAAIEVDRYVAMPAQALSYMVGHDPDRTRTGGGRGARRRRLLASRFPRPVARPRLDPAPLARPRTGLSSPRISSAGSSRGSPTAAAGASGPQAASRQASRSFTLPPVRRTAPA